MDGWMDGCTFHTSYRCIHSHNILTLTTHLPYHPTITIYPTPTIPSRRHQGVLTTHLPYHPTITIYPTPTIPSRRHQGVLWRVSSPVLRVAGLLHLHVLGACYIR